MFDVIIVGGGPAGLNAALVLGRSRRKVAVIDAGEPRNAPAAHAHGFLTRDGVAPLEILRLARAEVLEYGVELITGRVVSAVGSADDFTVALADGTELKGRRLLITSGVKDTLPDVPGLAEQWGKGVIHCPYCHGWEVRDQRIGVLATGEMSGHQAQMFRQLSDSVTVVEGSDAAKVLSSEDGALRGVELRDGNIVELDALVVMPHSRVELPFLDSLGLTAMDLPNGMGTTLEVDAWGKSSQPGIWAAGNVTDLSATVLASAAAGAKAGAGLNAELIFGS